MVLWADCDYEALNLNQKRFLAYKEEEYRKEKEGGVVML